MGFLKIVLGLLKMSYTIWEPWGIGLGIPMQLSSLKSLVCSPLSFKSVWCVIVWRLEWIEATSACTLGHVQGKEICQDEKGVNVARGEACVWLAPSHSTNQIIADPILKNMMWSSFVMFYPFFIFFPSHYSSAVIFGLFDVQIKFFRMRYTLAQKGLEIWK